MIKRIPPLAGALVTVGLIATGIGDVAAVPPAFAAKTTKATSRVSHPKHVSPKHVVVVIEENHAFNQIVGNREAPYLNNLMKHGALFTNYHGVTHPSQPNYVALFAGSTLGVQSDSCLNPMAKPNLGSELAAKGYSFTGYAQSLPSVGFTGCYAGNYGQKHAPWTVFSNLPKRVNQPFSHFPKQFNKLPTVSFVIPNVAYDMHSGSVRAGDTWLSRNLGRYARWAKTHNSVLMVTFDEGFNQNNQVATVFYGAGVKTGSYPEQFNHYSLLRTIEGFYRLPLLGQTKSAKTMAVAFRK